VFRITIQSANAGRVISGVTVRRPRPASGVRWLLSSCPARRASGLLAPPARLSAFERRYPGRYRHGQNLLANFALKRGRRKPTLGAPDYESGGREFESLRARQHLTPIFRAKNTAVLRNLQGASSRQFCAYALVHRGVVGVSALRRSAFVREMLNPYDRLKLEIVGSCFALHLANGQAPRVPKLLASTADEMAFAANASLTPDAREPRLHFAPHAGGPVIVGKLNEPCSRLIAAPNITSRLISG
jgi:hypothetical protein